jgi:hypothetical protein
MEDYKNFFIYFVKTVKYFIFSIEALALAVICQTFLINLLYNISIISDDQLLMFKKFSFNELQTILLSILLMAFIHSCYYLLQEKNWKILFPSVVSNTFLLIFIVRSFFDY